MGVKKFIRLDIAYFVLMLVYITGCRKPEDVNPVILPEPGQLMVAEVRSNGFIINWPGSTEVSSYNVYVSTDTNFTQLVPGHNPKRMTSTSDTIFTLTRATKYYIKVQAVKDGTEGSPSVTSASTTSEDVYLAGYQSLAASGSFSRAKYWVNGVSHDLQNDSATSVSEGRDIFISGNDVYVSGMNKRSGYPGNAVYWKNGKRVELTSGQYEGAGNAIFVLGNDIYVAGYSNHVWPSTATVWKNGQIVFADTHTSADVKSMFVSGTDVHLVGYGFQSGVVVAKYWKNGQPVILSKMPKGGYGNSVFVSGTDVYAAGYDITASDGIFATAAAKYWKNGSAVSFTDPLVSSSADGVYVDGNDVYISGQLASKPAYWKNGVATILPGGKNCITSGIYVFGKDVYVCGYEFAEFGVVAMYWKNGVPVELTSRYESNAKPMSIVVK